jgi:hypothetical protein
MGVQPSQRVPRALFGGREERLDQEVARRGWERAQGVADNGIIDPAQGVAGHGVGDGGQAGVDDVARSLQLAFEESLDLAAVLGRDPAAVDQDVGRGASFRTAQPAQASANCWESMNSSCRARTPRSRLRSASTRPIGRLRREAV